LSFRARLPANLATLANGLVGVGAIAYTLAGNPLWAMLLIVSGLGFDGLDGFLARRAKLPSSVFGRVADSISDSVTFGLAPGLLVAYHTASGSAWAPWAPWTTLVGALVAGLAIVRLVYFTLYGHHQPFFVGAPTPQTALAIVLLVLFLDVPGLLGTHPEAVLVAATVAAVLMVAPIRFPKIRVGARLRWPMVVTSVALVASILPLQFGPAQGSPLYDFGFAMSVVGAVGILAYYVVGPSTVAADVAASPKGVPHDSP
jgi:CDP-diacylglycerol--serine O-phosphatidyltransferase